MSEEPYIITEKQLGYITEEDIAEAAGFARASIALGCPWCKGAGSWGHECADRDHVLGPPTP